MPSIISKQEFDSLASKGFTHESLNDFADIIINRAVESLLTSLPQIIHHLIGQSVVMRGLSTDFYNKNPDLIEHKLLVAQAIEAVQSQHPGMKYEEILRKAGPMAREKLRDAAMIPSSHNGRGIEHYDQELGNL